MSLTTQRSAQAVEFAYLLVIEGLPYAFTDASDLGSSFVTGRTMLYGLRVPESVRVGVYPRTGMLEDDRATFGLIDDSSGSIRAMFAAPSAGDLDQILTRLDPTKTTGLGAVQWNGSGTYDLSSKHVGAEFISSTPSRDNRQIFPSDNPAPRDHIWSSANYGSGHLPRLFASDDPFIFAGRRVALYRIIRDEAGSWDTWQNQYDSGALIWYGTLTGRGENVNINEWEIEVAGPRSWLTKQLNAATRYDWVSPVTDLDLEDGTTAGRPAEDGVAFWCEFVEAYGNGTGLVFNALYPEGTAFDTGEDLAATTANALVTELNTLISDTLDGTLSAYNATGNQSGSAAEAVNGNQTLSMSVSTTGVTVDYSESISGGTYAAWFYLGMHAKAWAALGFHPWLQTQLDPGEPAYLNPHDVFELGNFGNGGTHPQYGSFAAMRNETGWTGDGYILIRFPIADGSKTFANPYGTPISVLTRAPGQEVRFPAWNSNDVAIGQTARPVGYGLEAVPEINSTDCDRVGYMWFRGGIRKGANAFSDSESETIDQIAEVCWRATSSDGIYDDGAGASVIIQRWLDPRLFGFANGPLDRDWLFGGDLTVSACFIGVWTGSVSGPAGQDVLDMRHRLITRTLLSSGTCTGWTGDTFDGGGTNQPTSYSGNDSVFGGDVEVSTLGLNIPDIAVDADSFVTEAQRLGSLTAPLNRVRYKARGPVQSDELLSHMMQGAGWAFSWKRDSDSLVPEFGCFSPWAKVSLADVDATITEADIGGKVGAPRSMRPRQRFSGGAPVDKFTISAAQDLEGNWRQSETVGVLDPGAYYRSGRVEWKLEDSGLPTNLVGGWLSDFRDRFGSEAAEYLASRSSEVTLTIQHAEGKHLGPGAVCLISNGYLQGADGSIGVTNGLLRVLEAEYHLIGERAGSTTVRGILQEKTITSQKLWCPSAYSTSYSGGVLTCSQDWLSLGHGSTDVAYFEEPSYTSLGGTVTLTIYQSPDGKNWTHSLFPTVTATLSSVTTGSHQLTITGVTGGTLYEDSHKIITLEPWDDQAAGNWPASLFAVITEDAGSTFGGSSTEEEPL